jgi:hypothetical protein
MSGTHYGKKVYFLRAIGTDGPVKIGCSDDPVERLKVFGSLSPYPLEILVMIDGSRELEWNIHDCFYDQHSHHEWFLPSPRLSWFIKKLQNGIPVHEAIDLSDRRGSVLGKVSAGRAMRRRARAAA